MKVYLIKASAGSSFSTYKKKSGGPPQNIFSVAAATPSYVEIEMTDETIGSKTNFKSNADVIAIFMSTPDALRAYDIAKRFRSLGKTVVLGGLHTFFMQEEALQHADALLIGEPEEIWEDLLNDFQNGVLKSKYQRKTPFNLKKLKPYPIHLIDPEKYGYMWSVVVSRGCPYHCEFCVVHKFFDEFQLRPVEEIVKELKNLKAYGIEWVELHSDNLTANRKYALELFEGIKDLKMNFFSETTILIAKDDELLQAAADAGVKNLLFGIETISKSALKGQKKNFVRPEKIKEHVEKVKSYGISVSSDFLFGFDEHDENIFEETLDFINQVPFDEVYPHFVIPFPGTELFKKLEAEGRILTKDWSQYNGEHAVYQPKLITPQQLEEGTYWVWEKYKSRNQFSNLLKKVSQLF